MALIRKQDTASLLNNGHFSSSLFDWSYTGDVRQIAIDQNNSGTHTPNFAALIPAGKKIWQTLSRTDVYSYPSRHLVTKVTGTPVGINTINLKPLITLLGNGSIFDPPVEQTRRNFSEIQPGSQIIIRDLTYPERSESYRAGKPNEDGTISASPLRDDLWRLATSSEYYGATVTDVTANSARVSLTGFHSPDRGDGTSGIKTDDVFVFTYPEFFVARVDSVATTNNGFVFGVKRVDNSPFFAADTIVDKWFVSPTRNFNVFYDAPLFRYEFTLALSVRSGVEIPTPQLQLFPIVENAAETGAVGEGDPIEVPSVKLNNDLFVERVTSAKNSTIPTTFTRFIYRFVLERSQPVFGTLRVTIAAPNSESATIGAVVLYKGNYTNRHDYDDRDADAGPGQVNVAGEPIPETNADPANSLDSIDRLLHGSEETNVIPKGTVVLHLGSACPAGFKRVDALANSAGDGFGESVPAPDFVEYDADRDRTILTWSYITFDFIGDDNKPVPIESDQQEIVYTIQHNVLGNQQNYREIVKYGPNQPWIQPGMSLRIRTSDIDSGTTRLLDYSAIVRQVAVKNEHVTVAAIDGQNTPTFLGPYPYYLASWNHSPGEANIPPVGPWTNHQPGGAGGFGLNPASGGAIAVGLTTTITNGDEVMHLNNVNVPGAKLGKIVYVRWTAGNTVSPGNFVGQIKYLTEVGPDTYNLSIVRYDGNPMVVDPSTTGQSRTAQATVSLFEGQIFDPRAVVTRIDIQSGVLWSVRLFENETKIAVSGNVAQDLETYNISLSVEPTGFLKFGEPGFSYGSMGHSHKITQGDAPFNTNIAPHYTGQYYTNPRSEVGREHGHGFMPKHTYPIPEFVAYMLCEKI